MSPQFPLFFFFLFLTSQISSLTAALTVLPQPDPAAVQSFKSPLSTVIPAFPEQSDVASRSTCQLSLPADLTAVSSSCSSLQSSPCCPALAAALYSAYSASALSLPAARSLPADLPDLPDDPESCSVEVERQLVSRGVHLPRVNATCDAAYCFCGVRLRRLTCAGGAFVADGPGERWAPTEAHRRKMEMKCRSPGIAGCTRCLHVLNQLNGNMSASARRDGSECQLVGLTWLLSKNTTLYLPAATSVLRALMADPTGAVGPTTCSLPYDEMPFAVGADRITDGSSAVAFAATVTVYRLLPFLVFLILGE